MHDEQEAITCLQEGGAAGVGVLQKLQKTVSSKATPLLALAGMAQADAPTTQELLPLKSVLRQELQLNTLKSGSQSIEPFLLTGGAVLQCMSHASDCRWCWIGSLQAVRTGIARTGI